MDIEYEERLRLHITDAHIVTEAIAGLSKSSVNQYFSLSETPSSSQGSRSELWNTETP